MTFERGIWKESARNFWLNKWMVLLAVGIIAAVSIFEDYTHSKSGGGTWVEVVWLSLVIAAHGTVLNGTVGFKSMNGAEFKSVFSPFLWRSLGLSVLGIVPAVVILIAFGSALDETYFILFMLVIYAVFESLILAKWGTMLPACVAQGDKTLKSASARGSKTFGYSFGRFWGCNALVLAVGLTGLIIGYSVLDSSMGISSKGMGAIVGSRVLQILITIVFAFNLVMLATILSRAYLIAEANMKETPAAASVTSF